MLQSSTDLQNNYAAVQGSSVIYTLEAMVDGQTQFVGSDSNVMATAITRARSRIGAGTVVPISVNAAGDSLSVHVAGPIGAAQVAAIRTAVDRFGVMVFRGQSSLQDDDLAALEQLFGPLFNTGQGGFGSDRTVMHLTNLDEAGNILPINDKFRAANAANAFWHVDNSFS